MSPPNEQAENDGPEAPEGQTNDEQGHAPARDFAAIESAIGYTFKNRSLLESSLTHPSFAHENPKAITTDNQRLEFLGDAVLGLIIARELYDRYPDLPEGHMSRIKSALVCEDTLAVIATRLELGQRLLLGRGETSSGGNKKASILSDGCEAVFASVYLDGGYDAIVPVIGHLFADLFEEARQGSLVSDYKTALQEHAQAGGDQRPAYRVVERSGPAHDRLFRVVVALGGKDLAEGQGRSKKEAEKAAAGAAIRLLKEPVVSEIEDALPENDTDSIG